MADQDPTTATPAAPAFDKRANHGFTHLVNATRFSLRGLRAAVRHEAAFRQELACAVILLPAVPFVAADPFEALLLVISLLWVLVVELLNSALEAVVDRGGREFHELAGRAKDLGSAAVFLSLVAAAAIWLTLGWQNLLQH